MLFEYSFTPTDATWQSYITRGFRDIRVGFKALAAICLLLAVAELAAFERSFGDISFPFTIPVLFVLATIFYVIPIFQARRYTALFVKQERLINSGKQVPLERGAKFYDDFFETAVHGSRYAYSQITNVLHDDNYIFIAIEDQIALPIKRDSFTTGCDETLIAFLGTKVSISRLRNKKLWRVGLWFTMVVVGLLVSFFMIFRNESALAYMWRTRGGDVTVSQRGQSIVRGDGFVYFQVHDLHGSRIMRYSGTSRAETFAYTPELGVMDFVGDTLFLVTPSLGVFAINDGMVDRLSGTGGICAVFTDDWIFVQSQRYYHPGWHGEISRIRPDGSEFSIILDHPGVGLQLYEGSLYFYSLYHQAVVRVGLDGGNKETVLEGFMPEIDDGVPFVGPFATVARMQNLQIHSGLVYYINPKQRLYRVDMATGQRMCLNAYVTAFAITHDSIVTLDYPAHESNMSAMLLNGSWHRQYVQFGGRPVDVGGDLYFWQHGSNSLFRANIYERGITPVY